MPKAVSLIEESILVAARPNYMLAEPKHLIALCEWLLEDQEPNPSPTSEKEKTVQS